ncbi:MAG: YbjN domain-containing protein [Caldilineaceae bacterium]|nr:YbjN domain-containing protein [Caldilineaceae bacterium]
MMGTTLPVALADTLTLFCLDGSTLSFAQAGLLLAIDGEALVACHLLAEVDGDFYRQIEADERMNYGVAVRSEAAADLFDLNRPVTIRALLRPDLLDQLPDFVDDARQMRAYLADLRAGRFIAPLLFSENWFITEITQTHGAEVRAVHTFWAQFYETMDDFAQLDRETVHAAITAFVQERARGEAARLGRTLPPSLADALFADVNQLIREQVDQMLDSLPVDTDDGDESLWDTVIRFFVEDDWPVQQLGTEPILLSVFEGEHGRWNCLIRVAEEQDRVVFYSIVPEETPPDRRLAMAEFLTRANYGMLIGNFEMDFNDGEVRYKTSIDVEGDRLTSALMMQIVYANVRTMDRYLPGIQQMMETDRAPAEIIASIEQ